MSVVSAGGLAAPTAAVLLTVDSVGNLTVASVSVFAEPATGRAAAVV